MTFSSCDLLSGGPGIAEKLKRPSPAIPAYGDPAWSPDGQYIGFNHRPLRAIRFDSRTGQYVYEFDDSLGGFWVISASGGAMKRVAPYLPSPAWTKDGGWIAYEHEGQIWKASVSNDSIIGPGLQVTSDPDGALFPAWSPDGNRLLYCITSGPSAGLRMTTSDGVGNQTVGMHGWIFPDWHPDGSRILFLGQVGAAYGIGSCDSLGLNPRSLSIEGQFPAWSPDGTKVAFISLAANPTGGPYDVWVADSSGASPHQLTHGGVGGGRISWSPDGTRIVYLKLRPNENSYTNGTLWIMRVDTGQEVQLTFTPG